MSGPVLVIGGDGLIGQALAAEFRRSEQAFVSSSRRENRAPDQIPIDLANGTGWFPRDLDSAIICAAATNLAFCRDNPAEAERINVTNTLRLARSLSEQGVFVVFLSTNLVFDGETPNITADAPLNPRTVYGRYKAEAERLLPDTVKDFAIIRLSKVFTKSMPLLLNWRKDFIEGKTAEAFADYRCSPIDIGTTAKAIAAISTGRRSGIWQLSPEADVSYADIAAETAKRLELSADRTKAIQSTEKTTLEHIPKHTTLDASRAHTELNLEFPPMPVVLDRVWDS
jgi:dTDP-4-dehydrorhamnose reductase